MDIEDRRREPVKFGIASMHDIVIKPGTIAQHTDAYIAAFADPTIDVIGHPGNPTFCVHIEDVVLCAKRYNKMIEINNHSSNVRRGSHDNCLDFARLCKKHDVRVCVSSDAHYSSSVGNVPKAMALLDEVDFPADLIVNLYEDRFDRYLEERQRRQSFSQL
jgi:putative hydrolase